MHMIRHHFQGHDNETAFLTDLLQDFPEGLRLMGLAWLISPFGLPLIAAFLVELLGVFNDSLKAI